MTIHIDTAIEQIPRHRRPATVTGTIAGYEDILSHEALMFLADLERRFGPMRRTLLEQRELRQARFDAGELPHLLPETKHIRQAAWEIADIPDVLRDRQVEITGPTDRKMMINALNSGANMFMADLEDATAPCWANVMQGQINLRDYAQNALHFEDKARGKSYQLNDDTATMIVRPRGFHLEEAHILVDGEPMSGSLVDFGLHLFTNGSKLLATNRGPFYYLPKLESHLEARLWNDIFAFSQAVLDIPHGSIKATVLIETLPAAFEMDEILFELKDHIAGLNCGRWDYIFSYIKVLRNHKEYLLPDRQQVVMNDAFLRAYSLKLIETCHRRKAHAMGGMAAQIPVKNDAAANDEAFARVKADKQREVEFGHDGTWVAHPGLVSVAREVFENGFTGQHQINRKELHAKVSEEDLLRPHKGEITESGIRTNISVGIRYISAWLAGRGAVPIHNLMEDAATAEISRTQIWQWLRHGASTDAGKTITQDYIDTLYREELATIKNDKTMAPDAKAHIDVAADLFLRTATSVDYVSFLTLPAYRQLNITH